MDDLYVKYKLPDETMEDFKSRYWNMRQSLRDLLFYIPDREQAIVNTLRWQQGVYYLYQQYGKPDETFNQFINWAQQQSRHMEGSIDDKLAQLDEILVRTM